MKRRFVQRNGELVEVGLDYLPEPRADIHVMGDIQPYKSMIDGSLINSRSTHREHLRAHGCIEVGNDSSLSQRPKPMTPPSGLKDRLIENAHRFLRERK